HDVLRLEREAPGRLDDGGGDRIVSAPGAERRERTLVVAPGETEGVLRQRGGCDFGLGNEGHGGSLPAMLRRAQPWAASLSGTRSPGSSSASTPSTMKLEEIGRPL